MFTFRAMSTDITVVVPDVDPEREARLGAEVAALFAASERRFSRFLGDSELSRLNRAREPFVASNALFSALERARGYHEETEGLFDPAIGVALLSAGYDRSFEKGALDRDRGKWEKAPARSAFSHVMLLRESRTVCLPPNTMLDLGGFIKGWTADEAVKLLPENAAVDAGGDAALRGKGPDGDGWLVDVEDPRDASRTLLTLRVGSGAVATSASNRRTWRVAGEQRHHIVDPRTQSSAKTDLAQATVFAPSAERADVWAKVAFLLGLREAKAWLSRMPDTGAVLVGIDGHIDVVGRTEVVHG